MATFSDIKIYRLENSTGSLLARGSVVIADLVRVNFSILEGKSGKFVTLPSEKSTKIDEATGKNKYFPLAQMVSRELSDELNKAVLAEYEGGGKSSTAGSKTTSGSKKPLPF